MACGQLCHNKVGYKSMSMGCLPLHVDGVWYCCMAICFHSWMHKVCGCCSVCSHVIQLLPITCTQWNLCCISKYALKHRQTSNWKSDLSWFGLKHVGFKVFALWSSPNNTTTKFRCSIKKSNRTTPAYLTI